jgi:hypothetical protein
MRIFDESDTYIDVHSWTFTPSSFFHIMNALYDLGMTRLKPVEIYPTLHNELEFFAVLDLQEKLSTVKDEFVPTMRGESLRLRDDIIADLRRRLDQADAERRDVQTKLVSLLSEPAPAPATGFLSRVLGLSGLRS